MWMLISQLRKKSSQITKPDSQIIRSRHLTFNWPVIDFSACDKTQYIWGYPLPKDNLHMKQKNITMYVCGVPDPKKLTMHVLINYYVLIRQIKRVPARASYVISAHSRPCWEFEVYPDSQLWLWSNSYDNTWVTKQINKNCSIKPTKVLCGNTQRHTYYEVYERGNKKPNFRLGGMV